MTDSQRILAVIEYSKMSRRSLGIDLGYADGAFLFHVISGRNGISAKLADKINKLFPELSYRWLIKGEGEMIVKKESNNINELMEKIEFLERHIKGLDARITLLENTVNKLSDDSKIRITKKNNQ